MKKDIDIRFVRWLSGAVVLTAVIALILFRPFAFLFSPGLPFAGFAGRAVYILILACALCLFRVMRGPTGADRIVAIDIFGIMIIGFCAVLTISSGRMWYMDIGIAWALQSFIATLALSKYLEGKGFEE